MTPVRPSVSSFAVGCQGRTRRAGAAIGAVTISPMLGDVMLASAGALLLYMVALWALSLPLKDVSIVDPGWGLGFVIVAWLSFAIGNGCTGRRALLAAVITLWGLRLTAHLT